MREEGSTGPAGLSASLGGATGPPTKTTGSSPPLLGVVPLQERLKFRAAEPATRRGEHPEQLLGADAPEEENTLNNFSALTPESFSSSSQKADQGIVHAGSRT